MSTTNNQKQAARQFVKEWSGKGYEKGETQRFWMALLHDVLGVENPVKAMEFEIPVKTILKEKGSDFIDGYITATKVLIEQKGSHVDLSAKARQSDGSELTPYQQGRFGVLTSSVHMAWMRVVCGRLKSDYRYSKEQVYNPFPWPTGKINTEKIEKTAQGILDTRAKYPGSSFANLYDPVTMPYDLQKAHRANDAAVLEAYGFPKDTTESEIVSELFKLYQKIVG